MSVLVAVLCGINAPAYAIAKVDYVRLHAHHPLLKDTVTVIVMSPASLARSIFIDCSIAAVFALAAIAPAGATLAGKQAGHTAFVVLSFITLMISVIAFPIELVWTAAAIATLVLLKRPESRAWFARK